MPKSQLELVAPVPDENSVKRDIIAFLVYQGAVVLRINSGAVKGKYEDKQGNIKERFMRFVQWFALGVTDKEGRAGVSDILALLRDGRTLIVEAKRQGNTPTPAQERFMEEVRKRGHLVIAADCLEDVEQALEDASRRGEGVG